MGIFYNTGNLHEKVAEDRAKEAAPVVATGQEDDFNPYDYISVDDYPMTRRGRARYQEDLSRLLYIAQIEQENRMNEYNSPSAQAARMRAAGLNPDLAGVENHGATNVAGYQGNPLDGVPSNMDVFTNVIGVVSSVGSIASALMSGIPELESRNIEKIGASISQAGPLWSLFDSVGDMVGSGIETEVTPHMIADLLPSLPKRYRARISKAFNRYKETIGGRTNFNSSFAALLNSQGDSNRARVNPFNADIDDKTWALIWKPYYDGVVQAAERFLAEGKSATSQAEMDQLSTEMFRDLKKPLQEVIKNIDKYFNDNTAGSLLKAATAAAILQYLPL